MPCGVVVYHNYCKLITKYLKEQRYFRFGGDLFAEMECSIRNYVFFSV